MKKIRYILHCIVWIIVGSYLTISILLHVPAIQIFLGNQTSNILQKKFGTKVVVGKIEVGLPNQLILNDIFIKDQAHKDMLKVSRLATDINIYKLITKGRIDISSAQIFGMQANLYRTNAATKPNFQFVLDSLSSKDNEKQKPLDLHIQSLIIRHGNVKYNQIDAPKQAKLDTHHLNISDISAHLTLQQITNDSIAIKVRSLSAKEQSGLDVKLLAFTLNAGKNHAQLDNFKLQLPHSTIRLGKSEVTYNKSNHGNTTHINKYALIIDKSEIAAQDFAFMDNSLKGSDAIVNFHADISGNNDNVIIHSMRLHDTNGLVGIIANGSIKNISSSKEWKLNATDMKMSAKGVQFIISSLNRRGINLPEEIGRMGNIRYQGTAYGKGSFISAKGLIKSDVGNATLDGAVNGSRFKCSIMSDGVNLAQILQDNTLGIIAANISTEGILDSKEAPLPFQKLIARGDISRLDYNQYSYRSLKIDGTYHDKAFNGTISMDDPNGKLNAKGLIRLGAKKTEANLIASVSNLSPKALHLTDALGNYSYTFNLDTRISGSSLIDAVGFLNISNINLRNKQNNISIENLYVTTGYEDGDHTIDIQSDFGNILVKGRYDYNTISKSIVNLIASKIPTMPQLPNKRQQTHNDMAVIADIYDVDWLSKLLDIPLHINQPVHIKGIIDDDHNKADIDVRAPSFNYGGMLFSQCNATLATEGDTLYAYTSLTKTQDDGSPILMNVEAKASNNKLLSHIFCDTHSEKPLKGNIYAETDFYKSEDGQSMAHIRIHPSELLIDNSIWYVQPSDIIYFANNLNVDHFQINNNDQHIIISGMATKNPNDSLVVDLNNIDVGYILDLVNFHSVEFSGYASGTATVKDLFGTPDAKTNLTVKDFRFEKGRMGTLYANAYYDIKDEQINISAHTDDEPFTLNDKSGHTMTGDTYINGYVSPKRKDLDIHIATDGARAEFIEDFCGSFMDNVTARARGACRVFGTFKNVNLEGQFVADGQLDITTLNTTYTLRNDTITLIPDHIIFQNDTVFDRDGHRALVTGGLNHTSLKNLTYDININADNFLAYDFHDYGAQVFYGTVYGTGLCYINGRKGEVAFNIEATPEKGSFIEYNAAHADNISKAEFIRWNNEATPTSDMQQTAPASPSTDVHINLHANANDNFTLRILMDETTGDKIALVGNGDLRANYFNKGAFDMYGSYLIDHGTYVMTIQNVIKKTFTFQNGSTMTFGGDPFDAVLNLKGQYTVPAVSLSDLQMGRSFTQNNIRVNCLMNIGGTAGAPLVTFDLDMPTLSTDAKQMVMSVINSQEDLNQQVLYLLAVGRFMPQSTNNATEEGTQQSQTSLAMQSILSGTISQQLNNVITSMVKNPNWNFGANISTGDEGLSNAEYEGMLSGRLLNNRLLINGEFGYRDNVNTQQSSFIGDFDVRYLLYPNGNLAVKVYNQTNDRYFTRNSLNTQGIGLIIKKDFNSLSELLGKKKKR